MIPLVVPFRIRPEKLSGVLLHGDTACLLVELAPELTSENVHL